MPVSSTPAARTASERTFCAFSVPERCIAILHVPLPCSVAVIRVVPGNRA
jgi:hypothetical protein